MLPLMEKREKNTKMSDERMWLNEVEKFDKLKYVPNLVVMVFDRVLRKDSNEKYAHVARLKLFEDSWIFLPQEVQSPQDERVEYFSLRCD